MSKRHSGARDQKLLVASARSDALLLAMIGKCFNPVHIFTCRTIVEVNALHVRQFTCFGVIQ